MELKFLGENGQEEKNHEIRVIGTERPDAEDKDCVFEFVEDDVEMNAVFKIFEELLEDVDIER